MTKGGHSWLAHWLVNCVHVDDFFLYCNVGSNVLVRTQYVILEVEVIGGGTTRESSVQQSYITVLHYSW